MRLESLPDTEETTILVDPSARISMIVRLLIGVVAIATFVTVWLTALQTGAAAAFVVAFVAICLTLLALTIHLPSSRPLVLSPEGAAVKAVGTSLFIHWDGVEHLCLVHDRRPLHSGMVLAIKLRPGAEARELVRPSGWLGRGLVKEETVVVPVAADIQDDVVSIAHSLHRQRLAETLRLESPLTITPPYPVA
jgi:hypothetical protein